MRSAIRRIAVPMDARADGGLFEASTSGYSLALPSRPGRASALAFVTAMAFGVWIHART